MTSMSSNHRQGATLPPGMACKSGAEQPGYTAQVGNKFWQMIRQCMAMLVLAAVVAFASPAAASTMDETSQPGGQFSNNFAAPTPVATGIVTVFGTGEENRHDFLVFEGLLPGEQILTITFNRAPGTRPGQNSGGEVLYRESPFLFAWDGESAGEFRLTNGRQTRTIEIELDDDFAGGDLYVGLYFTFGPSFSYEISAPTNVAPPPPPPAPPGVGVMLPADAPGGAFSTRATAPTPVPPGYIAVEGEGGRNALFFEFTNLPTGVQTLTFEFSYPDNVLPFYWAGGTVMASETPFRWDWDGTPIGNFAINPFRPRSTMTLTTGPNFGGTLHVGLYFTYGSRVKFRLNVPSNASNPQLPDVQAAKSVRVIDTYGQGCAAIGASAAAPRQAAIPGACMEFLIEARNAGDGPATDIQIEDLLNPNLIFIAAIAEGFDPPGQGAEFRSPAANTDCATGACRINLRNGYLRPGSGGRIVIRTLIK
jgi:uncharacterized repeat protein (TIGR01451 family)